MSVQTRFENATSDRDSGPREWRGVDCTHVAFYLLGREDDLGTERAIQAALDPDGFEDVLYNATVNVVSRAIERTAPNYEREVPFGELHTTAEAILRKQRPDHDQATLSEVL